jgi:2-polyprenyl-3-methyl-5-hydroxy-6-metoxy-1,4-benzoquinol methylase
MKKFLNNLYMKYLLKLDNYLYRKITDLSIKLNNGLHPKHKIMNFHQFFFDNIESGSTVLDIGCGNGALTLTLSQKAKSIFAIDINERNIRVSKANNDRENITYIVGDATTYDFKQKFDYIILSNVLEHIKNRTAFLLKILPLAETFLIRVPMLNRSWLAIYKKELGIEYRLDPTHYIEYTNETFKQEMNSVGLTILSHSIQFGEIWARVSK